MARIVVMATIGLDRVWTLDRPLRAGGRHVCEGIETRLGGGGFNTGDVLIELGHEVVLVTNLADDDGGRWCRAVLDERGFDTRFVESVPGATVPTEVFVDPAGERTILRHANSSRSGALRLPPIDADAGYLNVRRVDPAVVAPLKGFPWVVSQFPLDHREARPADVLIASRSDVAAATSAALWRDGVAIAGERLETIILTNGPEAVTIVERGRDLRVAANPVASPIDTTGAGDFFVAGYIDAVLAGREAPEAAHLGCIVAARHLGTKRKSIWAPRPIRLAGD